MPFLFICQFANNSLQYRKKHKKYSKYSSKQREPLDIKDVKGKSLSAARRGVFWPHTTRLRGKRYSYKNKDVKGGGLVQFILKNGKRNGLINLYKIDQWPAGCFNIEFHRRQLYQNWKILWRY